MFYPQEIVEQVIESNNIVDVISEYVKLTKKGSTYFGLCPFHNEKTPSFSVTDNGDRKMFYCFGCHTGGNALTFLMKYENLSYTEALKSLAQRAGVTLPEPEYSKEEASRHKLKEDILAINKEAAVYFYHLLKSERGSLAYRYLKNRQLSDDTIRNFGLGYSDKYRDDLYRYIKAKGFSDEALKASGLFSIRETNIHDYFWNRVMFPIMDTRNRVIAFGGRVMGEGEPKYLNSPETPVFEKSRSLFGLHIARKYKGDELILCEGYMDVISLHQAGFSNAVASLGTALTSGHVSVLRKYASNIVISYDSDTAGRDAAIRAIPKLREAGLKVRVINLKPYKDPDELIKAEGAKSYEERLKTARNSVLFELDVLKESYDFTDPDSRTGFDNEVARRLSYLDNEFERENYLQTVSREFGIDYTLLRSTTVRFAMNRDGYTGYRQDPPRTIRREQVNPNTAVEESQKMILTYLAAHPSFYGKIRDVLHEKDFTSPPYDQAAVLLFDQIRKGKLNVSGIIAAFEDEETQEKVADLFQPSDRQEQFPSVSSGPTGFPEGGAGGDLQKMLNQCIINIRSHSLEAQIAEGDLMQVVRLKKEQEELKQLDIFS